MCVGIGVVMAEPKKPLMRCVGEFFGHVLKGATTDVSKHKKVIKHEEHIEQSPDGKVTLRRTTIEEIEVQRDQEK